MRSVVGPGRLQVGIKHYYCIVFVLHCSVCPFTTTREECALLTLNPGQDDASLGTYRNLAIGMY